MSGADLSGLNLSDLHFSRANLSGAFLNDALLLRTSFAEATLSGCFVYGIAAWDVNLKGAIQSNLVITPQDEPAIEVDNLEMAQFIYPLLNNKKIRHVIGTITSEVVLILGRFTAERNAVLEAIRETLRKRDRLPILFDF